MLPERLAMWRTAPIAMARGADVILACIIIMFKSQSCLGRAYGVDGQMFQCREGERPDDDSVTRPMAGSY